MRRLFLAAIAALLPLSLWAQDINSVRNYAARAMPRCPDGKLSVTPIDKQGPAGFVLYDLTFTSSDRDCGRNEFVLVSPRTQQVLMGNVFALPFDTRPIDVRVAEKATELLKTPMKSSVSQFPLGDGLHAASITKATPWGPFSYHGFVDASQMFLIVGTRGSLTMDPAKTMLDSIGLQNAARRGNPKAKSQIVELSDFECPTCGRAHKVIEPLIEKHLANVDYYRLDLPLFEHHEWALDAAMGARALRKFAPSKYWEYVNFVFANQEPISKQKFETVLKNFCEDRDVKWAPIQTYFRSPSERAILLDQVSRAFDNGIVSTPTYIVNGKVLGYGPSGEFTIKAVKEALGVK